MGWDVLNFATSSRVRNYCMAVSLFHLLLVVILAALISQNIPNVVSKVTQTMATWVPVEHDVPEDTTYISGVLNGDCPLHIPMLARSEKFRIKYYMLDIGYVDVRALVIIFHFLSFLFQFSSSFDNKIYVAALNAGEMNLVLYDFWRNCRGVLQPQRRHESIVLYPRI
jgi:hypothetical protein